MITYIRDGIKTSYHAFIAVKHTEPINSIFHFFDLGLGFVAIHNLLETYYFENYPPIDVYADLPSWQRVACKTADVMGDFSLILGAIRSKPVVFVWNWTIEKILTPNQLMRFFGTDGLIPSEQAYRTIALTAFILGLPSLLKSIISIYQWQKQKPEPTEPHHYVPHNVRKTEVLLAFKEISETAQRIIMTSPRR